MFSRWLADGDPVRRLWFLAVAVLMFAGAVAVYLPALGGPFLMDDLPNLIPLRWSDGRFSIGGLLRYLESGWTGPTGRPVALITFYLNAQNWPTDPWTFKVTNLALHLVNGALVLLVTRMLLRGVGRSANAAAWVALGVAAAWLVHPLHVSTVMYVSQRMTELATLFILLGLTGYVWGRALARTRPWWGYAIMGLAVGLGTLLAIFSKEIGVLLPLYVLVAEVTLLAGTAPPLGPWRWYRAALLYLPCLVLAGYFLVRWEWVLDIYTDRHFSLVERLLTEPRVLFDYLQSLLLPWHAQAMLFHDDFPLSTGLLTPATTLPSLLAVLMSVPAAILLRRRLPVLSFAVLWFLAGHVLESSALLGIEIYFEHRNYLPALGPLLALVYYLHLAFRHRPWAAVALVAAFVAVGAYETRGHARDWSSISRLSQVWFEAKPHSAWVHEGMSNYWLKLEFPDRAYAVLEAGTERSPDRVDIELLRLIMACRQSRVTAAHIEGFHHDMGKSVSGRSVAASLEKLFGLVDNGRCGALDQAAFGQGVRAMLANPHFSAPSDQARLMHLLARSHYDRGNYDDAIAWLEKSLAIKASIDLRVHLAYWHFKAGELARAQRVIDTLRETGQLDRGAKGRLDALRGQIEAQRGNGS